MLLAEYFYLLRSRVPIAITACRIEELLSQAWRTRRFQSSVSKYPDNWSAVSLLKILKYWRSCSFLKKVCCGGRETGRNAASSLTDTAASSGTICRISCSSARDQHIHRSQDQLYYTARVLAWLRRTQHVDSIAVALVGELKHGQDKNLYSLRRSSNLCRPLDELVSSF